MALVFVSSMLFLLPLSKLLLLSTVQRLVAVLQCRAQMLLALPLVSLGGRRRTRSCFTCEWSVHCRCCLSLWGWLCDTAALRPIRWLQLLSTSAWLRVRVRAARRRSGGAVHSEATLAAVEIDGQRSGRAQRMSRNGKKSSIQQGG